MGKQLRNKQWALCKTQHLSKALVLQAATGYLVEKAGRGYHQRDGAVRRTVPGNPRGPGSNPESGQAPLLGRMSCMSSVKWHWKYLVR